MVGHGVVDVEQMIKSVEEGAGLLHKITKHTARSGKADGSV